MSRIHSYFGKTKHACLTLFSSLANKPGWCWMQPISSICRGLVWLRHSACGISANSFVAQQRDSEVPKRPSTTLNIRDFACSVTFSINRLASCFGKKCLQFVVISFVTARFSVPFGMSLVIFTLWTYNMAALWTADGLGFILAPSCNSRLRNTDWIQQIETQKDMID